MNDIYVAVALLGTSVAAIIWLAIRRPSLPDTEPKPDREPLAADCMCMVNGCPREWQTDRTGWRLCHTHYRELVKDRRAS